MVLVEVLISVILISLLSLVGAITLAFNKHRLSDFMILFVAFASGSLLVVAFLEMIPEAMDKIGAKTMPWVLSGVLLFFLVEKYIHWHHCGKEECHVKPVAYLNLLGDSVHNFIDGLVISAAYLSDTTLGVVTTVAMALHEIPQEFGDFSVLIHSGMKPRKALFYNFLSATTAVFGAVIGFLFLSRISEWIPQVLAVAAGGFIYISTADLMPELHKETKSNRMIQQTLALLAGVFLLYLMLLFLPEA